MMEWTAEQIIGLAPDPASAKAGKDLAIARKWVSPGCDERSAWGECPGSGKLPYRTQIDLSEPAFRCTCPSRKFPCKHGLGLFLLLESHPRAFTESAPPQWVTEWLAARAERSAKSASKKEEKEERPVDPAAQARRADERVRKVRAGLEELGLWLTDLVRGGLAAAQKQPASFWESPAARMVDAQAPGLARLVREIHALLASGTGWEQRVLERLGRLYLATEAYKRFDQLPEATQADLRSLIGWTQNQDELLQTEGLQDRWLVLGQRVEDDDRLRVERTWMWGERTARAALVLQFAHGRRPLDSNLLAGSTLEAELVFYPGSHPLRALVKTRLGPAMALTSVPGHEEINGAIESYSQALALNPWIGRFPFALREVTPTFQQAGWIVCDRAGKVLPLARRFDSGWQLLAASGGRPIALFGEWDGNSLLPLSAWSDERFIAL